MLNTTISVEQSLVTVIRFRHNPTPACDKERYNLFLFMIEISINLFLFMIQIGIHRFLFMIQIGINLFLFMIEIGINRFLFIIDRHKLLPIRDTSINLFLSMIDIGINLFLFMIEIGINFFIFMLQKSMNIGPRFPIFIKKNISIQKGFKGS